METILFPDVESLVIAYLKTRMNVRVSTRVPTTPATGYIKVTVVGGNKARLNADRTMVTFQCWHENSVTASELARTARAHVFAMAGSDDTDAWVYRVTDVGAPAFSPDPDSDTPRYQFTVMLDVKGEVLNG